MLDLLAAGQGQGRPRVAVEEEAGRLGQELGVGGVPPVDRNVDLTPVEAPGEPAHAPLLVRRRRDVLGVDVQVGEQEEHLVGRGQAEGGARG